MLNSNDFSANNFFCWVSVLSDPNVCVSSIQKLYNPINIVSTVQYYRLFGNSVAVPVMKELSVNVLEAILNRRKEIAA